MPAVLRRRHIGTALCGGLAALAAAGCGSSSSSSSSSSSAKPPTAAQAQAAATAINLRAGDVAGFTTTPYKQTPQDQQSSAQLAKCAGGVAPSQQIVDTHSPDFNGGSGLQSQQLNSSVTVLPTEALASQDLNAVKSAKAQTCIVQFVNQLLSTKSNGQVTFGKASLSTLAPPSGAPAGSFAYRVTVPAKAAGTTIPFYVDLLGFTEKRTEIGLTGFGVSHPLDSSLEQRLYSLLGSRATKSSV